VWCLGSYLEKCTSDQLLGGCECAGTRGKAGGVVLACPGATEGIDSYRGIRLFPMVVHEDAALSVRSHFFEFLPDGSDRPLLAHQLERGGLYSVVVTTGGDSTAICWAIGFR